MTDNQIIKAFKDFLNEQVDGYTDHVETGGERYEFIEKELELLKETDNLINRQQAEIEQWKEEANRYQTLWCEDVQIARAEVIKEFAERLKKEFSQCQREYRNVLNSDGACAMIIAKKVVDNLLKEMVGDNNA